jgi:hypothetical protein
MQPFFVRGSMSSAPVRECRTADSESYGRVPSEDDSVLLGRQRE